MLKDIDIILKEVNGFRKEKKDMYKDVNRKNNRSKKSDAF